MAFRPRVGCPATCPRSSLSSSQTSAISSAATRRPGRTSVFRSQILSPAEGYEKRSPSVTHPERRGFDSGCFRSANLVARDILCSPTVAARTARNLGFPRQLSEPPAAFRGPFQAVFLLCRPVFSDTTEPCDFGTDMPYLTKSRTHSGRTVDGFAMRSPSR